ncbi:hypothetical protein N0V95_009040 [Ascochyta clinopodiicola]|nr:hypothetical protein N0V95_009040 [Ascochyta clinopodiicola]
MRSVWPKLVKNNVNTVLGAVTWDQIEPEEGRFDFAELDLVISDARKHQLKLVLLWFGSFKNGLSTYVPEWVKTDNVRFPRAQIRNKHSGEVKTIETLSVFHQNSAAADAKAFENLVKHVGDIDSAFNTVIMIQVENEVGLLGDSRDRSAAAAAQFNAAVPLQLIETLQNGWDTLNETIRENLRYFAATKIAAGATWSEVFGQSQQADEIFMAYYYTLYVQQVAAAGKAAYHIPLFTNAWLRNIPDKDEPMELPPILLSGGFEPGEYPSGGPVETVLDIWRLFAPDLDFIGPDIYLSNYRKSCKLYRHNNQPLFIPEQRRDEYGALRMWAAIGTYAALGVSPFGIDSTEPEMSPFTDHYGLLRQVSHHILAARREGRLVHGLYFDRYEAGEPDPSPSYSIQMGAWTLRIARSFVFGHPAPGYGLVIQLEGDSFMLVGEGFQITFISNNPAAIFSGIRSIREKELHNEVTGELRTGRWLNGDETMGGRAVVMPSADPDYGLFVISSFIGSRTKISECKAYFLEQSST